MSSQCFIIGLSLALVVLGLSSTIQGAKTERLVKPVLTIRIQQCREGCLEKFAIKEALCQQKPECSLSGFPPYNYNSLPDALHLLCWDECAKPPPPKINKSILETWALRTVSMHRRGSLVLVDVAWSPFNTPNQCLVTWEVSGGGLMGNLLTESTNVQLSLWPDTKYRVQVTCKNKITGAMSRSLPLTIDTTEANSSVDQEPSSTSAPSPSLSTSTVAPLPPSSPSSSPVDNHPSVTQTISSVSDSKLETHSNDFDHFDWRDTDDENEVTVDKIAVSNPDIKILTIAALSRTQTPLVYGIIAGTFFLAVILCLQVCILRSRRIPSDKKALIDDDGNATTTHSICTASPPLLVGGGRGCGVTNHFGSGIPIDPVTYSRTVHVLTV